MSALPAISTKSPEYIAARKVLDGHRKIFDSVAAAIAALKTIYADPAKFPAAFPIVASRINSLIDVTGDDTIPPLSDWPAEYSAEGVRVCVSFLGVRDLKGEDGKSYNGATAFVIYPLPSINAIRDDASGESWLWKIVEKEASLVAFRPIREAAKLGIEQLVAGAAQMPLTVSDYVEESTAESEGAAFDGMWNQFRTMLKNNPGTSALVAGLPQKGEVVKSIRSKAYALQEYPTLENMGAFTFIAENMVKVMDMMKAQAVEAGEDFELDSSEITAWVAGRNTKVFTTPVRKEVAADAVDFGSFMSSLTGGAS